VCSGFWASQHLVGRAGVTRGRPAAVRRRGTGGLGAALRGAANRPSETHGAARVRSDPLHDARQTVQAGNIRVFAFGIYAGKMTNSVNEWEIKDV